VAVEFPIDNNVAAFRFVHITLPRQ